jgi:hypothetical protein
MPEAIQPIRCQGGHYEEQCEENAVHEVAGPTLVLLCRDHALERIAEDMDERWDQFGAEKYAQYCREAAEALQGCAGSLGPNPVLVEIVENVTSHLERHELGRARDAEAGVS